MLVGLIFGQSVTQAGRQAGVSGWIKRFGWATDVMMHYSLKRLI